MKLYVSAEMLLRGADHNIYPPPVFIEPPPKQNSAYIRFKFNN